MFSGIRQVTGLDDQTGTVALGIQNVLLGARPLRRVVKRTTGER